MGKVVAAAEAVREAARAERWAVQASVAAKAAGSGGCGSPARAEAKLGAGETARAVSVQAEGAGMARPHRNGHTSLGSACG